mmetsp:Transcript_9585/g.20377  ORF Transcript_9585/g.20377 Transcript_9585/m.20377 type:complete len:230 (+) Transcript_9585:2494-3183(+)
MPRQPKRSGLQVAMHQELKNLGSQISSDSVELEFATVNHLDPSVLTLRRIILINGLIHRGILEDPLLELLHSLLWIHTLPVRIAQFHGSDVPVNQIHVGHDTFHKHHFDLEVFKFIDNPCSALFGCVRSIKKADPASLLTKEGLEVCKSMLCSLHAGLHGILVVVIKEAGWQMRSAVLTAIIAYIEDLGWGIVEKLDVSSQPTTDVGFATCWQSHHHDHHLVLRGAQIQ